MSSLPNDSILASSFRDPSGFLFRSQGVLYRQVNRACQEDYQLLFSSGLYSSLVRDGLLVPHEEADLSLARSDEAFRVIQPTPVPFISYPYEWCFSQLKDAALATLAIQRRALDHGMALKDSSAYNIQFYRGRPVLIDTLSFTRYREGEPWVAYRQFCQHFLAPMALMGCRDIRLGQLSRVYIDGIPLDLASALLPFRTRFRLPLLMHLHLHARSQKRFSDRAIAPGRRKMSKLSMRGLVDNLASTLKRIHWSPEGTEWAGYYEETNYSPRALESKSSLVSRFLDELKPSVVWDLGSNVGLFSRIASRRGCLTISWDIDPAAVERNYLQCVQEGETNLLPLLIDLANPSPDLGWENRERDSLIRRGPADTVLALALVHHLAISNNVPFPKLSGFFQKIGRSLIIEFVPKTDSQVQRLLKTREDIFPRYNRQSFEEAFAREFIIRQSAPVEESERILYLMVKK